jgi:hypothetical protein
VFIRFLEEKFAQVGVRKVVPPQHALEKAFRRYHLLAEVQKVAQAALGNLEGKFIHVPEALEQEVRDRIEGTDKPWDDALRDIVREYLAGTSASQA